MKEQAPWLTFELSEDELVLELAVEVLSKVVQLV
jgi:hypothetical protein